jgi:transposase-like protein
MQKGQRRFTDFDDKIIAMYGRRMTTREIQAYIKETYNYEVSPDLIPDVTEEVMKEVIEWQNRTVDNLYLIMYLDAIPFLKSSISFIYKIFSRFGFF